MNRRKFFKRLLVGAAAIVVAPKIIAEVIKPDPYKNLYYPSMQDITYEQFLRYCNIKLPSGQMIVYGTGGNGLTETTFREQWEQFIIEGKMGYNLIRSKSRRKGSTPWPMFYDEAGPFPSKLYVKIRKALDGRCKIHKYYELANTISRKT